ncbi:MAG: DNA cytosine methyltransferase, partial [Gammaproteobacteria bacterium]|nr:DNA cytosine methyltransferase [Gammaproteobacteria bacterium]
MPYDISESKRDWYRQVSQRSRLRKQAAARGELGRCQTVPSRPALRPETLMPIREPSGLTALSLFSGGGGLDLGFERAGFQHVASFDVLDVCGATLLHNRPQWKVFSGATGDVNEMDWSLHANVVDVLHGGPPCQPFSVAGKLFGAADDRDMWPAFTRAVLAIRPKAFVAENVPGLLGRRFASYVDKTIYSPLSHDYHMVAFRLVSCPINKCDSEWAQSPRARRSPQGISGILPRAATQPSAIVPTPEGRAGEGLWPR